jgi:type I restriction enzyme M protein
VKNPRGGEETLHRRPEVILEEIAALDADGSAILAKIRTLL